MNLRFGDLVIQNFYTVGNVPQVIRLDARGVTLLLGQNADMSGADARNGVGKSTVLYALFYVLFGKPFPTGRSRLDNLINNENKATMLVTLDFTVDGVPYRIERGRKPAILHLLRGNCDLNLDDGETVDESRGENSQTQKEIERLTSLSPMLFRHIVGLNTVNEPFLRLDLKEQTAMVEELLRITLLRQRADVLNARLRITNQSIRDEEGRLKSLAEHNRHIEASIAPLLRQQTAWQDRHRQTIDALTADLEVFQQTDWQAEEGCFDRLDAWMAADRDSQARVATVDQHLATLKGDQQRLLREASRLDEATGADPQAGRLAAEIRRLETALAADQTAPITRLTTEIARSGRRVQTLRETAAARQADLVAVQAEHESPDGHRCATCGQGLSGTAHLATVKAKLRQQIDDLNRQIAAIGEEIAALDRQNQLLEADITTTRQAQADEQRRLQDALTSARADLVEGTRAAEMQAAQRAADRAALDVGLDACTVAIAAADQDKQRLRAEQRGLGPRPQCHFADRRAVYQAREKRDSLQRDIAATRAAINPFDAQIAALRGTLRDPDEAVLTDLRETQKHEDLLYQLLTKKDSLIRGAIIEQNLALLNDHLRRYTTALGLPHDVQFCRNLDVQISKRDYQFDFPQLSRGEMQRVNLSLGWAFRNIWEAQNGSLNLLFIDEMLDYGMDDQGVEAALRLLRDMAHVQEKCVFVISHQPIAISRADRLLMVHKKNDFTTFEENAEASGLASRPL